MKSGTLLPSVGRYAADPPTARNSPNLDCASAKPWPKAPNPSPNVETGNFSVWQSSGPKRQDLSNPGSPMSSKVNGFCEEHSSASNAAETEVKRRVSDLRTTGVARAWLAKRMGDSLQRSSTCLTRSEGLEMISVPPISFI